MVSHLVTKPNVHHQLNKNYHPVIQPIIVQPVVKSKLHQVGKMLKDMRELSSVINEIPHKYRIIIPSLLDRSRSDSSKYDI